jgi:O-methyltransferase involved in polyketide biosynthesis
LPVSSEVIFSFVLPDRALPPDEAILAKAFVAQFAAMGEPWLSRFVPEELTAKLVAMGFSNVFHLSPEEANRRYFANRSDGLNASLMEQMLSAKL